jgi:hypothetical protein
MNSKSDELRSQLPHIAAELAESIRVSLEQIRAARALAGDGKHESSAAWRQGLDDALKILRPAQDAHGRFLNWIRDVLEQEVDQCGLTAEEREVLFGVRQK